MSDSVSGEGGIARKVVHDIHALTRDADHVYSTPMAEIEHDVRALRIAVIAFLHIRPVFPKVWVFC
jgi:hypothetical protein